MDRNGYSDPYVKLSLCGKTHKSSTIKKTLNPRWNESFDFKGSLRQLTSEPLRLECWDWDFGPQRNDRLGDANVDLTPLRRSRQLDLAVPLHDQQATPALVHLRLSWVPDIDMAEAASAHGDLSARDMQAGAVRALLSVPFVPSVPSVP